MEVIPIPVVNKSRGRFFIGWGIINVFRIFVDVLFKDTRDNIKKIP